MEKKDIQTRIQHIQSIEIASGPLVWLLGLGISTLLFYGLGIIFIILYFFIRQQWLIIYTSTNSIIVFYQKTQDVEGFKSAVLTLEKSTQLTTLTQSIASSTTSSAGLNCC